MTIGEMTIGEPMAIDLKLIDNLLADYKKPEDIIGENGLLKQLTKAFYLETRDAGRDDGASGLQQACPPSPGELCGSCPRGSCPCEFQALRDSGSGSCGESPTIEYNKP
jgi:hypothetical protein